MPSSRSSTSMPSARSPAQVSAAAAIAKHGDKIVEVEGFQCMVDFLLKLRKMNVIFGEAPMLLRYDLKLGDSKMRVVRTMRQTLLLMLKRRFNP